MYQVQILKKSHKSIIPSVEWLGSGREGVLQQLQRLSTVKSAQAFEASSFSNSYYKQVVFRDKHRHSGAPPQLWGEGFKNILSMIDRNTRWFKLAPLVDITTESV